MSVDKRYFVDVFTDIMSNVQANYDTVNDPVETPYAAYGHMIQVIQMLTVKGKHDDYKFKMYPLVVLLMDFEERPGGFAYEYIISPRFLILHNSKREYKPADRYTNIFKTVLYPIYRLLLEEIAANPMIHQSFVDELEVTKYDRVFWGSEKAATQLNNYLDGIDVFRIKDLKVFKETPLETTLQASRYSG